MTTPPRDMTLSRLDPEAIYRRLTLAQAADLLRRPQPPRSLLDAIADRLEAVERDLNKARAAAHFCKHQAARMDNILRRAASPTAEDWLDSVAEEQLPPEALLDQDLHDEENENFVDYDAWLAARALHRLIVAGQIGPIASDISAKIEAIASGDISDGAYEVERLMLEFAHLVDLTSEQTRARYAGAEYPF